MELPWIQRNPCICNIIWNNYVLTILAGTLKQLSLYTFLPLASPSSSSPNIVRARMHVQHWTPSSHSCNWFLGCTRNLQKMEGCCSDPPTTWWAQGLFWIYWAFLVLFRCTYWTQQFISWTENSLTSTSWYLPAPVFCTAAMMFGRLML